MTALQLLALAGVAAAGFAFGVVFFRLLERSVALYLAGHRARAAALQAARMLAAIAVFVGAAMVGAGPALAVFAGLLLARARAARTAGRT